jgi:2-polyprenyl-3-methyl-5-hydroxy-6-metoxy-1,4-benzoquinol methylase
MAYAAWQQECATIVLQSAANVTVSTETPPLRRLTPRADRLLPPTADDSLGSACHSARRRDRDYFPEYKVILDIMTNNTVDDYGWSSTEGPLSCDYISPKILSILRDLDVQRVVDIGAGNGSLCADIHRAGYQVVGVEYDQQGVEIARRSHPEVPFYNIGVQDDPAILRQQQELFDVAVSTEVIEHLFTPQLLPIFAGGLLKENGLLILTTPYHGYLKNLALSLANKWDDHHTALWHGGHIKFWSRATLRTLLEENGFEEIDFSGVGRIPYLWKSMIIIARKLPPSPSAA